MSKIHDSYREAASSARQLAISTGVTHIVKRTGGGHWEIFAAPSEMLGLPKCIRDNPPEKLTHHNFQAPDANKLVSYDPYSAPTDVLLTLINSGFLDVPDTHVVIFFNRIDDFVLTGNELVKFREFYLAASSRLNKYASGQNSFGVYAATTGQD